MNTIHPNWNRAWVNPGWREPMNTCSVCGGTFFHFISSECSPACYNAALISDISWEDDDKPDA
jgi:hypothetical protein